MADTPSSEKNKIFVAGLPWATNQNELYELVKPSGNIVEAKIILDRGTGKSKGFAFIEMSTEAEAKDVIGRLNGLEVGGRTLFATEFKASSQDRDFGPRSSVPSAPAAPAAPRPTAGPPGGVERRSGRERRKNPGFGGPAPERREFKKPWEKKPWSKDRKPGGFGDKKPWVKKPWDKDKKEGGFGDKKPWEKKPWDRDRKPGGFGDKKPWEKKPWDKDKKDGGGFAGKKPWAKKPFGKKPFGRKPGGFRGPKP